MMTENAFAYIQNRSLHQFLRARAISHIRTRLYTSRTNGTVELTTRALQRDCAYVLQ